MSNARASYESKVRNLGEQITRGSLLSRKLSIARIATALPGILLMIAGWSEPQLPAITWQLGLGLFVGFLGLATWQENLRGQLDWLHQQLGFYRRMSARCERE